MRYDQIQRRRKVIKKRGQKLGRKGFVKRCVYLVKGFMYVLDGHTAVLERDIYKWGEWFQNADRVVKKSFLEEGDVEVSTVFLGIDHSFSDGGPPILFETMVFGGPDQEMDRCSTWEKAEKMHEKMVRRVS